MLACVGLLGGAARAQTAHASGTVTTLSSGFSNPVAVAVDGSGNVFVADQGLNLVKEMLAVNGVIPSNPTIKVLGSGFSSSAGVAGDGSGNF